MAKIWKKYLEWNRLHDPARHCSDETSWYDLLHMCVVGLLRMIAIGILIIDPMVTYKIMFIDNPIGNAVEKVQIIIGICTWIVAAILLIPAFFEKRDEEDL